MKDKSFCSKNEFATEELALNAYEQALDKLFKVHRWNELSGVSSSFHLYDKAGQKKTNEVQQGDFIKILLPGPVPENWVTVVDIQKKQNFAEFTVSPSYDPTEKKETETIEHFFIDEATSTFKVELKGKELIAYEIGKNEGINNTGEKSKNRKLINTIIAHGGWAGFQEYQWTKLTDFLVHKSQ